MKVEIDTEATQFHFWEYLFQIFSTVNAIRSSKVKFHSYGLEKDFLCAQKQYFKKHECLT